MKSVDFGLARTALAVVIVGTLALISTVFIRALYFDHQRLPSPLIDRPLPNLKLSYFNDAELAFDSRDLLGRYWVLNIWASWCAPCLEEWPSLLSLMNNDRVELVGLSYKDEPLNVQKWLVEHGDPFDYSTYDPLGRSVIEIGVYGVPETYLIDPQGIVRDKVVGVLPADVMTKRWRSHFPSR